MRTTRGRVTRPRVVLRFVPGGSRRRAGPSLGWLVGAREAPVDRDDRPHLLGLSSLLPRLELAGGRQDHLTVAQGERHPEDVAMGWERLAGLDLELLHRVHELELVLAILLFEGRGV